ncbi:transposase [Citreicella sp. SE45]|nr:transposase [Citreicella sp. SE45]
MSARPGDFSETIKKLLADRAGHECSMPYCRVRTVGPGAATTQTVRVGQASHIYSAGLKEPRGRGGLSDAQLADPSNGIWTCELHGKDVDNNKGDAFPAGLLRSWKELHEARVKRMSTGAPAERWIEHVRFMRTPLFEPDSVFHLGKVTVIGGTNGVGKTAICEWVGAVRDKGLLDRWTGSSAFHAINLEISFTSDKEHVLGVGIPAGGTARFTLDGAPQLAPPLVIDTVFLRERYLPPAAEDDLRGLAKFFSVDADTIRLVAEEVGASGNKRFRHLGFEPVPLDEGEPPESVIHEDGTPKMRLTVRKGLRALKNSFEVILEERKDEISPRMRTILIGLNGDWLWLDDRIETVSKEIEQISRTEENCVNVMTIPGIGPMISTAMVAAIGTGEAFGRGRDFAAWVGLVPRQYSTGGRTVLGRISKRGSRYLRMLFVQAAKVILMRANRWAGFSFGDWLIRASERMNRNKLAVALANKLARMAWSILRHRTAFDAPRDEVAAGI